jgi:ribosomal protein S27E
MRKVVHCTKDPTEVTCKTCLKSLNKPDKRVRYRTHYAPGTKSARARGDVEPNPVCGRDDSDKFVQTFSHTMREVNCPICRRIMQRGRRKARKPRVKLRVPGRSTVFLVETSLSRSCR